MTITTTRQFTKGMRVSVTNDAGTELATIHGLSNVLPGEVPVAHLRMDDGTYWTCPTSHLEPLELVTIAVAIAIPARLTGEGIDAGAYAEQVLRDALSGWEVTVVQVDHHTDPDVLFHDGDASTLPAEWR